VADERTFSESERAILSQVPLEEWRLYESVVQGSGLGSVPARALIVSLSIDMLEYRWDGTWAWLRRTELARQYDIVYVPHETIDSGA